MEELFRDFDRIPKNLVRRRKLSNGHISREIGPFIWGWSMTMGTDKKPILREFGNFKPADFIDKGASSFKLVEKREPLVDVTEDEKMIIVIVELPGVNKNDIKLSAVTDTLIISVDSEERKYYKELELVSEIIPSESKASYNNGVLKIELIKVKKKQSDFQIKIN